MSNPIFFIWVCIAITQITLFTIFLIRSGRSRNIEESIDIIPVCNYNGKTYWLDGPNLYREDIRSRTMDIRQAERIDQLNPRDLSVSEIIFIIETIGEGK